MINKKAIKQFYSTKRFIVRILVCVISGLNGQSSLVLEPSSQALTGADPSQFALLPADLQVQVASVLKRTGEIADEFAKSVSVGKKAVEQKSYFRIIGAATELVKLQKQASELMTQSDELATKIKAIPGISVPTLFSALKTPEQLHKKLEQEITHLKM